MFRKTDPDLTALDALLTRESAALDAGDTQTLADLTPEKQALLDRLDARADELQEAAGSDPQMTGRLAATRARIHRNGSRLAHLAGTVRGMADALTRISARHGLGGLYAADGTPAPKQAAKARLDREV